MTLFSGQHQTVDDLLKRAYLAMYQAKEAGRNTMRFFDPEMQAAVERGVVLQCGPAPDHIHSVAAPVRDAAGAIVAAINVAAAAPYLDPERMQDLIPLLRTAAAEIGTALGREGTVG